MKKLIDRCALGPWMAAVCLALVGPVQALDLAKSVQLAKENDPRWSRIEAVQLAAVEKSNQVRAALLPEVGLSSGYSFNHYKGDAAPIEIGDSPLAKAIVDFFFPDLTEPVVDSYRARTLSGVMRFGLLNRDSWFRFEAAKHFVSQAEAERAAAGQGLLLEVAQAYFSSLSALIDKNFALAEMRASGAQREQIRLGYEEGVSKQVEVLNAETAFDSSKSSLRLAEGKLAIADGRLGSLVGQDVGQVSVMRDDFEVEPIYGDDVTPWLEAAEEQNPGLLARKMAADSAQKEYQARKATHWPKLDLVARYDDFSTSGGRGFTPGAQQTSIGLELNVPIYQGGRIQAAAREAAHRWVEAKDLYKEERIRVQREVKEKFAMFRLSVDTVEYRKKVIATQQQLVQKAEADYQAGTGSFREVIESMRLLVAAKKEYESARIDYILERLQFRHAIGQLGEAEIGEVNDWLVAGNAGSSGD